MPLLKSSFTWNESWHLTSRSIWKWIRLITFYAFFPSSSIYMMIAFTHIRTSSISLCSPHHFDLILQSCFWFSSSFLYSVQLFRFVFVLLSIAVSSVCKSDETIKLRQSFDWVSTTLYLTIRCISTSLSSFFAVLSIFSTSILFASNLKEIPCLTGCRVGARFSFVVPRKFEAIFFLPKWHTNTASI